jgi:hypothetical protein
MSNFITPILQALSRIEAKLPTEAEKRRAEEEEKAKREFFSALCKKINKVAADIEEMKEGTKEASNEIKKRLGVLEDEFLKLKATVAESHQAEHNEIIMQMNVISEDIKFTIEKYSLITNDFSHDMMPPNEVKEPVEDAKLQTNTEVVETRTGKSSWNDMTLELNF